MAMTTCSECEGAVSDTANTCPHCGFPLLSQKMSPGLFWQMVKTCFFWGLAAIPAAFVVTLIVSFYIINIA